MAFRNHTKTFDLHKNRHILLPNVDSSYHQHPQTQLYYNWHSVHKYRTTKAALTSNNLMIMTASANPPRSVVQRIDKYQLFSDTHFVFAAKVSGELDFEGQPFIK